VSLNSVHFSFWIRPNRESTAEHQYLLAATLTLFNQLNFLRKSAGVGDHTCLFLFTGFCYWISHLCSWLRPIGKRAWCLHSWIYPFCSSFCHACNSNHHIDNWITCKHFCNRIRHICFKSVMLALEFVMAIMTAKKLSTWYEVNDFHHGGCYSGQ